MKTNTILNGDALQHLKEMPSESINCVMTSPPYWALRDYVIEGQLGLEKTFEEYINKLCDIFDEVKRVLRKDGTCWVNLGDTYGGTGAGQEKSINSQGKFTDGQYFEQVKSRELKAETTKHLSKCLIMIPFRFAIEMVNRGWILRNTIIWHKPNCMPSSVKDRFTVDFEYLFFFVKNKKYWFEMQYDKADTINWQDFNKRVRDVKAGRIASEQYHATKGELDSTNTLGARPNSPHFRGDYLMNNRPTELKKTKEQYGKYQHNHSQKLTSQHIQKPFVKLRLSQDVQNLFVINVGRRGRRY